MKTIKEIELNSKKVILRLDLNVPIQNGKITSKERIIASLPTIEYLINQNAKIIILSHLGKIKTEEDKQKNTLYPVYEELLKILKTPIYFSSATKGKILEDKISKLKNREILLVENTRYEDLDNKKESNCDEELSKYWANLGEVFINDAFGLSHRKHASNYGISKYLPTAIGPLIEKEIKGLEPIIKPTHPFTIIMGGAKVSDKLDIIKNILPKCDYLLLGGGIANSFLACKSEVGKSLADIEKKSELQKLLNTYSTKIILPTDVIVENKEQIIQKEIKDINKEDIIYDIGEKTIKKYQEFLSKSSTIFINGTLGLYENNKYEQGTKAILQTIDNLKCIKIAGGGDALASIEKYNIKNIDFKSTGGGATLKYIAENKLNCLN